jgi:hypothetical protein
MQDMLFSPAATNHENFYLDDLAVVDGSGAA